MSPTAASSAAPQSLFQLNADGDLKPAVMLGQGLPGRVSDMNAFYYWKDAIIVGSYLHPAGKFSLQITRDKLDGYVRNFSRMKKNGVAVPILMDHAPSAAATLGWIIDVQRRDDHLMELHQFLGETARDIGLRNKVSLGIDPNFIDGKGNHYGEAIVHSAVTPMPVVPNQGAFEAVEMGGESCGVIALSRVVEAGERSTSNAQLSTFDEGETEVIDLPTPAEKIAHHTAPGDLQLAITALTDAAAVKRDQAIAKGGVDPAVAQEIFSLLTTSTPTAPHQLLLSRTTAGTPLALAVFDALSRNRPVPLGEVTQLQVLSRLVPGIDSELANLQQQMIVLASGGRSHI